MNIDVTALKAVERERGIPADTVLEAIESALVTAYRHADGAAKHVRVHVDRKSGEVAVLAQELGPDGEVVREWDDTPTDFGRIAASTAKQVIVQRLRDAEHEQTSASTPARRATSSAASCRRTTRNVRARC